MPRQASSSSTPASTFERALPATSRTTPEHPFPRRKVSQPRRRNDTLRQGNVTPLSGSLPRLPVVEFAYHRLARSWTKYAWWKPLVTAVIGGGIYLALSIALAIVFVVLAVVLPDSFGS